MRGGIRRVGIGGQHEQATRCPREVPEFREWHRIGQQVRHYASEQPHLDVPVREVHHVEVDGVVEDVVGPNRRRAVALLAGMDGVALSRVRRAASEVECPGCRVAESDHPWKPGGGTGGRSNERRRRRRFEKGCELHGTGEELIATGTAPERQAARGKSDQRRVCGIDLDIAVERLPGQGRHPKHAGQPRVWPHGDQSAAAVDVSAQETGLVVGERGFGEDRKPRGRQARGVQCRQLGDRERVDPLGAKDLRQVLTEGVARRRGRGAARHRVHDDEDWRNRHLRTGGRPKYQRHSQRKEDGRAAAEGSRCLAGDAACRVAAHMPLPSMLLPTVSARSTSMGEPVPPTHRPSRQQTAGATSCKGMAAGAGDGRQGNWQTGANRLRNSGSSPWVGRVRPRHPTPCALPGRQSSALELLGLTWTQVKIDRRPREAAAGSPARCRLLVWRGASPIPRWSAQGRSARSSPGTVHESASRSAE